jgi:flagellar export protein FliJ
MRRFRFRLAPLLRLRAQFERSARRDLAAAVAAVSAFDQRLAAAERGLEECGAHAAADGSVGRLARALETGLRRHQWRLRQGQQQAQQQLDVVRRDYVVKTRDLRTLRQLRTERHAEWRLAAQREEQRELDELASMGREAQRRGHAAEGGSES